MDGGSKDGTIPFLKTLTNPFSFVSEIDKGIYDAMNKGIRLSKGDWLYFMGADDCFADENLLKEVFSEPFLEEEVLLGNIKYTNKEKVFNSNFSCLLWLKNTIHHQSVFYKKSIFDQRVYNSGYKVLADYDLNLYLYKNKAPYRKLNKLIAICGDDGVSKQYNWKLYKEEITIKSSLTNNKLKIFFYLLGLTKYFFRRLFLKRNPLLR
ncbi:Glycosyl transferase family 2 [Tenacibaculum amylolyticum]